MTERIEKLKQFLQSSPNDSFLKHALALEYVKCGQDDQAEEMFSGILKADKNYIGSYYHLGKLLERKGEERRAIEIYAMGMEIAKTSGDNHALSELRGAWEELADAY